MRTVFRLAVALAVTVAALVLWETAASAATAVEYALLY